MTVASSLPASPVRARITSPFRRLTLAPVVWVIAGISFVVHVLVGARVLVGSDYGYFRDELYTMAMSHHPALGYVDVPPLVPWITLIPRFLTDNALWAIHGISALGLRWDDPPDRADGPAPRRRGMGPGACCRGNSDGTRLYGARLAVHL